MTAKLKDHIVLFFCCLVFYLCTPAFGEKALPVLLAVALLAFENYFIHEREQVILAAGFLLLCAPMPGMTAFLPAVCCSFPGPRYRYVYAAALIPLFSLLRHLGTAAVGVVLLFLLGYFLEQRSHELESTKQERNQLRDDAKELSIMLEERNRRLLEQQDSEVSLATLNERNRIARDIHDGVGHLLSSSILQVGALLAVNQDSKLRENLLDLKSTLSNAMDEIRTSVHGLYDESIDLYGQTYEMTRKFTFCKVHLYYGLESEPPAKLKYAFIAIVKESLTNIARHSNATAADITFHEHPALYQLIISDNGTVKNFNPDDGIGLKNITRRVESFHGNLNVLTQNGFKIFISIPKGAAKT